jgi:hypothetical protein
MELISIAQFLEPFISAIPVRERAFLLFALLFSTIAWVFHRKLRSLPRALTKADEIGGSDATDKPRLDDALVAFFAASNVSSGILGILRTARKPLGFKSLAAKIRHDAANSRIADVPPSAIRAVLSILQFARLVRMRGARFSLTPLGFEVHRRMKQNVQLPERVSLFTAEARPALP